MKRAVTFPGRAVLSVQQRDGLGRDYVHQWPALRARKYQRVEFPGQVVVLARENHAASRTPQGLVRGSRHNVGIRNRVRVMPAGDQTRETGCAYPDPVPVGKIRPIGRHAPAKYRARLTTP